MKYSFVIPTYNNKVLLRNTLEALNYQKGFSKDDYEVIVVDDGSTDNTIDYIKGTNKKYNLKCFYIERTEESSRSRTRNLGWRNASGDIIIFIDSDIIVRDDYLLELDRCFNKSKEILVIGNRLMLNKKNTYEDVVSKDIFKDNYFDAKNFNILEYRYLLYATTSYNANTNTWPWTLVYSCNMAVPKSYLNLTGGFDENFKEWGMEDIELGYSLYKCGIQIVINTKLEVLHQNHGERNDLTIEHSKIDSYEKNIDYFINKHPNALLINNKFAYKFFEGEIPINKLDLEKNKEKIVLVLKNKKDLEEIKQKINEISKRVNCILTVYDHLENSDLDIWIQLKGRTACAIKYFPVSKIVDSKQADDFIRNEIKRQKEII